MSGRASDSPGGSLLSLWGRIATVPGGKGIFAWLLGRRVPYTATIRPRVEELRPGFARVSLIERRRVRNHLRSIHAVALANLGEAATGLAVITAIAPEIRAILVRLEVVYAKKGRGRVTATSGFAAPSVDGPTDVLAIADVRDDVSDLVATVSATWRLDRRPPASDRA